MVCAQNCAVGCPPWGRYSTAGGVALWGSWVGTAADRLGTRGGRLREDQGQKSVGPHVGTRLTPWVRLAAAWWLLEY